MKFILAWLAIAAFGLVSLPVSAAPDVRGGTVTACAERGDPGDRARDGCCDKAVSDISCARCCLALPGIGIRSVPTRLSGGIVTAVAQRVLPSRVSPPATPPPRAG